MNDWLSNLLIYCCFGIISLSQCTVTHITKEKGGIVLIVREHYKKLKSLIKNNGSTGTDYAQNKELYDYLLSCGFIKKADVKGYRGFAVTESGKVQIRLYKNDNFRFWFPAVVSVVALIVSVLAIFFS